MATAKRKIIFAEQEYEYAKFVENEVGTIT
jgi:hypothetical protein